MKTAAFMIKVKIVFATLFELWDYRGIVSRRVLETMCWKRSITCLCTEAEIELARNAYHAKVEEIK